MTTLVISNADALEAASDMMALYNTIPMPTTPAEYADVAPDLAALRELDADTLAGWCDFHLPDPWLREIKRGIMRHSEAVFRAFDDGLVTL